MAMPKVFNEIGARLDKLAGLVSDIKRLESKMDRILMLLEAEQPAEPPTQTAKKQGTQTAT